MFKFYYWMTLRKTPVLSGYISLPTYEENYNDLLYSARIKQGKEYRSLSQTPDE